tara:strand:- start:403 stop:783 length:381 start_codon:yes stop_codon:yes gene_type:complete
MKAAAYSRKEEFAFPFVSSSTRSTNTNLILSLLDLFDDLALTIILEATSWDLVQTQDLLVGVLDKNVLALLALKTHVGDRADDTPAVGETQVHLLSEIAGLPAYNTENNVLVVGLWVGARNESGGC